MAEHVDHPDTHPPPQELKAAWMYKRWGPPNAGGRLDQPAGLIEKMTIAENTYRVCSAYKALPAKELGGWIKNHKGEWQMWQSIQKLRANG